MKLIIAEKPDQERTQASPFQKVKRDGFLEIVPKRLFLDEAYVSKKTLYFAASCR